MFKRMLALLAALLILPLGAAAEKKVFMAGETEPFGPEERLLTLYVCPLMGADSALLTFESHSLLVDMGKENQAEDVRAMLTRAGLSGVEYAFNTHPHNDHVGGMRALAGQIGIGTYLTTFPHDYDGSAIAQRRAMRALHQAGVPIVDCADGDTIDFGDVEITVLSQTGYKTDNALSAMLRVRYGECTLLLTADVEGKGLSNLAAAHDVKADVAKFPHHGLTKMSTDFFAALAPEYMYFPHSSYGTEEAQSQLDAAAIPYHFATWGPIQLTTNGEKWIVEQALFEDKEAFSAQFWAKKEKKAK